MLKINFRPITSNFLQSGKQAANFGFRSKKGILSDSQPSLPVRSSSRENYFTAKLGMLRTHQSGKKNR